VTVSRTTTPEQLRRSALALTLAERVALVAAIDADLRLDERVIDQAAWLAHRLRGALMHRARRKENR
jgi:hypothetical protein